MQTSAKYDSRAIRTSKCRRNVGSWLAVRSSNRVCCLLPVLSEHFSLWLALRGCVHENIMSILYVTTQRNTYSVGNPWVESPQTIHLR
jgi:hypothetical protein